MSPSPSPKRKLLSTRRAVLGAAVFTGGLLAASTFTSAVPAAPAQVCLPVVGCVTTTVPSLPLPTTSAPLPTVTVPTLPSTTTTTTGTTPSSGGSNGQSSPPGTTGTGAPGSPSSTQPQTAFVVRALVRVRGRGAARVVELRLRLSKPARVSALLSRNGKALVRRAFDARVGSNLVRLRLGRAVKPGAARLGLSYRSEAGERDATTHRLRLPR